MRSCHDREAQIRDVQDVRAYEKHGAYIGQAEDGRPQNRAKDICKEDIRKQDRAARQPKRWSQQVTEHSDALDLRQGVFKLTSAKQIASSLKRSAERSARRKTGAYRSALSMLTFYINRAGKNLPKVQRDRLEQAKTELKQQFGRE